MAEIKPLNWRGREESPDQFDFSAEFMGYGYRVRKGLYGAGERVEVTRIGRRANHQIRWDAGSLEGGKAAAEADAQELLSSALT